MKLPFGFQVKLEQNRGEHVNQSLAAWLAGSFDSSMGKSESAREKSLLLPVPYNIIEFIKFSSTLSSRPESERGEKRDERIGRQARPVFELSRRHWASKNKRGSLEPCAFFNDQHLQVPIGKIVIFHVQPLQKYINLSGSGE